MVSRGLKRANRRSLHAAGVEREGDIIAEARKYRTRAIRSHGDDRLTAVFFIIAFPSGAVYMPSTGNIGYDELKAAFCFSRSEKQDDLDELRGGHHTARYALLCATRALLRGFHHALDRRQYRTYQNFMPKLINSGTPFQRALVTASKCGSLRRRCGDAPRKR
jgi:hypothetical protein